MLSGKAVYEMRVGKFVCMIASFCASALMLCGCDTPKSGKPGAAGQNDRDNSGLSFVPSVENEAQKAEPVSFSDGDGLLYDRCGVKVKAAGSVITNAQIGITAENSTDRKVYLRSVYIQEGDILDGTAQNLRMTIDGKSNNQAELSLPKSRGSLKMKLYLLDENRVYIEGSLSDTITVTAYQKKKLHKAYIGIPVYEDDKIKLTYTGAKYKDDSDSVNIGLYAVNKTDKDIYISSSNSVCVHDDFSFSMGSYIPANSEAEITGHAVTTNHTIGAGALDSITFNMQVFDADERIKEGYASTEPILKTDPLTVTLSQEGKPETVVPDRITEAETLSEVVSDIWDDSYSPIPDPSEDSIVHCAQSGIEVTCLGGFEPKDGSDGEGCLIVRVKNTLDKPVTLDPIGTVNGGTMEFMCYEKVGAMQIKYVPIYFTLIDTKLFGCFSDCTLSFDVRYDDGHLYDDESAVCKTPPLDLKIRERVDINGNIASVAPLHIGEDYEVRMVGYTTGGKASFCFFVLNKTDRPINVNVEPERTDLHLYSGIRVLPNTYAVKQIMLFANSGTDISQEDLKNLKLVCSMSYDDE